MDNAKIFREVFRTTQLRIETLRQQQTVFQDISLTQGNALIEIGRRRRVTLNELAEILEKDKSSVSRLMHSMIKKGWVIMEVGKKDARLRDIRLTKQGEQKYNTIENTMDRLFEKLINTFSEDEFTALMASLELLNRQGRELLKN